MISATPLGGLPEIFPGDDLAGEIIDALTRCRIELEAGDVLVVAHKVVSKAEGRIRRLEDIEPTEDAIALAGRHGKDPRHVQVILEESQQLLRERDGVLICVTHHGFVCANAGVDASNVPGEDTIVLLPEDPDASARGLRAAITTTLNVAPAVVVTDSFGRAWRRGQADMAIGCAGLQPLEDWRGRTDATGRDLTATWIGIADEIAAAADLARRKDGSQPVVIVRGAGRHVTREDGPGAKAMIRPEAEDLFR